MLQVLHAYREDHHGEEIIRIISARAAEKHEIRRYPKTGNGLKRKDKPCAESPNARRRGTTRISTSTTFRLSGAQLDSMVQLREARQPKVSVSVRLDARVLAWLKSKGAGHLTRIKDILVNLMEAEQGTRPRT